MWASMSVRWKIKFCQSHVIMIMSQVSTNPPLIQYSFLNVVGKLETMQYTICNPCPALIIAIDTKITCDNM